MAGSPASAIEFDDQALSYSFRNFADSDHVHVVSHFARYNVDFGTGTLLYLQYLNDTVTVPAIDSQAGTQEAVDAITTASRPITGADAFRDFSKTRHEFAGDLSTARTTVGYYLSSESDYFAQLVRGGYNRDFFDRNFNLAVGGSYGWDKIDPLLDDDTQGASDSRTTWNLNAVASQILSPTAILRVGADVSLVNGLQHNPYRNVYAGGGPVPEVHPDQRIRSAVFLRLSKYIMNRSSLQGHYVAYRDDWGLNSHSLEARLNQYITESVLVRYRYRFYTQTAADFYREEYQDPGGIDGYRTSDYRLENFNAHLFGAQINLNLGVLHRQAGVLRRAHLKFKFERYFNSNNFSANIFETGLVYQF